MIIYQTDIRAMPWTTMHVKVDARPGGSVAIIDFEQRPDTDGFGVFLRMGDFPNKLPIELTIDPDGKLVSAEYALFSDDEARVDGVPPLPADITTVVGLPGFDLSPLADSDRFVDIWMELQLAWDVDDLHVLVPPAHADTPILRVDMPPCLSLCFDARGRLARLIGRGIEPAEAARLRAMTAPGERVLGPKN